MTTKVELYNFSPLNQSIKSLQFYLTLSPILMAKHIISLLSIITVAMTIPVPTISRSRPYIDNNSFQEYEDSSVPKYGDPALSDYEFQDYENDRFDDYENLNNDQHAVPRMDSLNSDNLGIADYPYSSMHNTQHSKVSEYEKPPQTFISQTRKNDIQDSSVKMKMKRGGQFHKPDGRIRLL